jgi:hypothetical protein
VSAAVDVGVALAGKLWVSVAVGEGATTVAVGSDPPAQSSSPQPATASSHTQTASRLPSTADRFRALVFISPLPAVPHARTPYHAPSSDFEPAAAGAR